MEDHSENKESLVNGRICNIVVDKGFFFIKGEDNQQYFAHRTALLQATWIYYIDVEDDVQFDPTDTDKGPRAENVIVKRLNV